MASLTEKSQHLHPETSDQGIISDEAINVPGYDATINAQSGKTRKALLKVDLCILPFIVPCFCFLQFDRTNIGNALTDTLRDDINIDNSDINLAQTLFTVGFIVTELPFNMISKYMGPERFLPITMFLWGIATWSQIFLKSAAGLCAARFFVGALEGGYIPGFALYISKYYTNNELALRYAIFWASNKGVLTCFLGVVAYLYLPHGAAKPKSFFGKSFNIFTEREASILVTRVIRNDPTKALRYGHPVLPSHIIETFMDWRLYGHLVAALLSMVMIAPMNTYAPSIIKSLGFTALQANGLNSVGSVCALIWSVSLAFSSDKFRERGLHITVGYLWGAIGLLWLALAPDGVSKWTLYGGVVWTQMGMGSAQAISAAWLTTKMQDYKRPVALVAYVMSIQLSSFPGNQLFRAEARDHEHDILLASSQSIDTALTRDLPMLATHLRPSCPLQGPGELRKPANSAASIKHAATRRKISEALAFGARPSPSLVPLNILRRTDLRLRRLSVTRDESQSLVPKMLISRVLLERLERTVGALVDRLDSRFNGLDGIPSDALGPPRSKELIPVPDLDPPPVFLIRDAATDAGVHSPEQTPHSISQSDVTTAGLVPASTAHSLLAFIFLIAVRHTTQELADRLAPRLFEEAKSLITSSLLEVPQTVEFFQAALILSLWSTTIGQVPLSVDSWLLTGYALQQAFISPHFAEILRPGSTTMTTLELDSWCLWNHICVAHLQYCVGTRRQSLLTQEHIDRCLYFSKLDYITNYEARMAAEVGLYWIIYNKCGTSQVDLTGTKLALTAWQQEWAKLFDEPRSQFLQMGFHFAHLLAYCQTVKSPNSVMRTSILEEMIRHSKAIIDLAIDTADERTRHLTDHIYHTITFSALTLCRILSTYESKLRTANYDVDGLDNTVFQLINWLRSIGLPCHAAHILGDIISAQFGKLRPDFYATIPVTDGTEINDGNGLFTAHDLSLPPDISIYYPDFISWEISHMDGDLASWPEWS
ncbi:nicotinamide mononucleotide permease [Fusarium albosuccineum]|uniref:Nicotinamide mononucleotide permease n=1 Tax=Fusarium albosuccineum TaxID=1237068 RepID=A0A8H4PFT6_9HYPO|nr:nicotinamide mononucleotide permease [Fusarium albosuccineum]